MLKLLAFLVPLLRRVLKTNKFTSIGGGMALVAVVLLLTHHLSATDFLALIGMAVTVIGFASKDGIRSDATVAPEDVPLPPLPPTGAAVVLLLFAAGLLAGCSSLIFRASAAPAAQHGPHFGDLRPAVALLDAALDTVPWQAGPAPRLVVATPDSIDLPPAFAGVPEAPYLVAPPAYLSPRERRKFLRVQQRAQRRAARAALRTGPAKVKLGKGAAYNAAPAGQAVVQRRIDAPVGIGPHSPATDNSTSLPEPEADPPFWDQFKSWLSSSLKYLALGLGAVVVGALVCLRFSPFGRAVRGAASVARSAINSARS